MRAAAALAAVALAVGCGGRASRPTSVASSEVDRELAHAEQAERARQHEVARTHYLRAIAAARAPQAIAHARRAYGETLATWGELDEARAQLEASIAAAPSAAAWHDLGLLRHGAGDVPGAIIALEQARDLAPADPRPRIALAALRWKSADLAGATAEYRALLELDLPDRLREKVQWALRALAKP